MSENNTDIQAGISQTPLIIYEDNHLIAVNKKCSDLVQGDSTGDQTLQGSLKIWIREKYNKPGNVFLGVIHRLDRPVSGAVLFAKTGKALARMNNLFKTGNVKKTYWAITGVKPPENQGTLVHFLKKNQEKNKSFIAGRTSEGAKEAKLNYNVIYKFRNYYLLEIDLLTGRHHQIRCQLSAIGSPIVGDLKYGYPRSLENGGIALHSREISFVHPVSGQEAIIRADPSGHTLWDIYLKKLIAANQ